MAQSSANDFAMEFMEGLEKILDRAKVTWTGDKKRDLTQREVFWEELNATASVFFEFLVSDLPGDLDAKAKTLKNSFLLVTEKGAYDLKLSQLRAQNCSYQNDVLKGEMEDQKLNLQKKDAEEKLKRAGGMARINQAHMIAILRDAKSKKKEAIQNAPAVLQSHEAVQLFNDIKTFVLNKAVSSCAVMGHVLAGTLSGKNSFDQKNITIDEDILKNQGDLEETQDDITKNEMYLKAKLDMEMLLLKHQEDIINTKVVASEKAIQDTMKDLTKLETNKFKTKMK